MWYKVFNETKSFDVIGLRLFFWGIILNPEEITPIPFQIAYPVLLNLTSRFFKIRGTPIFLGIEALIGHNPVPIVQLRLGGSGTLNMYCVLYLKIGNNPFPHQNS